MLSDRSYMRSDYPRETTSAFTWLLSAVIAGSMLQFVFDLLLHSDAFLRLFALSSGGLLQGKIWTLLTFPFLHTNILYFVVSVLGLFLIGREIAPLLGSRGVVQFCLGASLLGGLAWFATHFWSATPTVLAGSSAVLAAMFVFFACVAPEREITFLLFFVLPVTLRPKVAAWIFLALSLLGFFFNELAGGALGWSADIAHSAHLGGMLAGWLYYRFFYANNGWDRAADVSIFPRALFRRQSKQSTPLPPATPPPVVPTAPADLRAEVDRILDKINSHGFGALTEQEKRLLDDAKDLLSRR